MKIFGGFYELVHVLEKFLRADTGIDLCCRNVGMSQHPADGFYRHTCFKRNQRGEAVPRLMESIVMVNAGLIPVYSSKDADILNYRKGLISFYENETYSLYTDYFLDRQMARIKELTTDTGIEM